MVTLHHHPLCPHSRFVRLALGEMAISPSLVEEKPWERDTRFLALDPAGETPVLVEGAQVVPGAMTIAEYLNETRGMGPGGLRLMPTDPSARVEVRRLEVYQRNPFAPLYDLDGARANLSAAVSLVLQLIGRTGDPGRSREHAFLSVLAEARLIRGQHAPLEALLPDLLEPPLDHVGALAIDDFLSLRARKELAADLNTLLTSPRFLAWRRGPSLDVDAWMRPVDGRTPTTVISVAHLDDEERALVLGVILEEVLTWVRSLPGTSRLKGLVVFDELYGFLPPHPASPPTKRPLVALMKQARAFGVGVVIACSPLRNDAEVTVAFPGVIGVKKLVQSLAKLEAE